MLARAFAEDPVASHLFPDPLRRSPRLRRFFALQLSHTYLPRGEVWVAEPARGAALWMPPQAPAARAADVLWRYVALATLGSRIPAARRMAALLGSHRPEPRHWYLGTVGVEPALQRRGLGAALLEPALATCDERGEPAYLECSRLENVAFYTSLGFALLERLVLEDGPPLWLMWREPLLAGT